MKLTTFLRSLFPAIGLSIVGGAHAQIGYQVSLLNNATGEPRANETVSVNIKITDSNGTVICSEVKSETTNDFGVVSMSVGNSETFADADWNNMPFFIEASVDGRLIGRSQLLSVPVAEHAKHTGTLTKEKLCGKAWYVSGMQIQFHTDNTVSLRYNLNETASGIYSVDGNSIIIYESGNNARYMFFIYFPQKDKLVRLDCSIHVSN